MSEADLDRLDPRLRHKHRDGSWSARFLVSDAGFDQLDRQVEEAVRFLRTPSRELESILTAGPAVLDFGIEQPPLGIYARFLRIPVELVRICGERGTALEVSEYAVSGGEQNA